MQSKRTLFSVLLFLLLSSLHLANAQDTIADQRSNQISSFFQNVIRTQHPELFLQAGPFSDFSVSDTSGCEPLNINFSNLSPGANIFKWYFGDGDSSDLANPSHLYDTSGVFTVMFIASDGTNTDTSYLEVEIYPTPELPLVIDSSRCGPGSITMLVQSAYTVSWYDSLSGGTLLDTGLIYTTPFLNDTTVYFMEAADSLCTSERVPIYAVILPVPDAPLASDVSSCGESDFTLNAVSPDSIFWFDSPAGGVPLDTGSSYTTPLLSTTTVYYTESGTVCRSARVPVQAIIHDIPTDPVTNDSARCGPGIFSLTAISSDVVHWYDSLSGGTNLNTGLNFITPFLDTTTTFYVQADNGNCLSSRVAVMAVVNPLPDTPLTSDGFLCGPGTVDLNANSPDSVFWFDVPTGGNPLDTGISYTTPVINSSTTYYVETGNGCRSERIPVQAVISGPPDAPLAADSSRCGPGQVLLGASASGFIYWFDQPSGGTALDTGTSFLTDSLTVTTTYYAEADNGCVSAMRTPVQAIIRSVPSDPVTVDSSRCGPGSLTLLASSAFTVNWYDSLSGGTLHFIGSGFTTPVLDSSTTYYAEAVDGNCSSSRVAVEAIIDTMPDAPVVNDTSRCGPGSLVLLASANDTVFWYDAASGGNILDTGITFTTPVINSSTTYYAETGGACRSARVPVQAVVDILPPLPVSADSSRCGQGTLILSATSPYDISWFDSPTGGTLLDTGSTFTTPSLTTSTSYYVEAGNGSCVSSRLEVEAIINAVPAPPVAPDVSLCGSGSLTLTATATETIYWYNAMSNGTLLGTGTSYTTPVLVNTTTYYVETGNTCRSTRLAVQAIIEVAPPAPVAFGVSRCGPGTVTLTATSAQPIWWYSAQTGGAPIDSGASFTTPSLSTSTTYYVEAGNQCRSIRIAVTATIASQPAEPVANNASRCGPGTLTLVASSPEVIRWYSQPVGGSVLFTGSSYTTPVLSASQTYYVEAGTSCASLRVPVQAIITSMPAPPVLTGNDRCGPGSVVLNGVSNEQINWYDAANGGNWLGFGPVFNTPNISVSTVFYADAGIGCNSVRVPVTAVVIPLPDPPVITADSVCGGGIMTLSATSSEQIYWYDVAVGGLQIGAGGTYVTPYLTSSVTYFVETGDNCRSIRLAVTAQVLPFSQFFLLQNGQSCGPSSVLLGASSSDTVRWYDLPVGGTLLGTGTTFMTPHLDTTTNFYAIAGDVCPSAAATLTATIFPGQSVDLGPDTIFIQSGQGVVLDAGSGFMLYQWSTGDTTQSIFATVEGMYFVTVQDPTGCFSTDIVYVSVLVGLDTPPQKLLIGLVPNPADAEVEISWNQEDAGRMNIEIYSADGRLRQSLERNTTLGYSQERINVSRLAPGIYHLRLRSERMSDSVRLLIQR